MKFKEVVVRGGLIGCGMALLVAFILILVYGNVVFLEPNLAILLMEILGLIILLMFATLQMVRDMKKKRKNAN